MAAELHYSRHAFRVLNAQLMIFIRDQADQHLSLGSNRSPVFERDTYEKNLLQISITLNA